MSKGEMGCVWFVLFLLIGVPMCDAAIDLKVSKQVEIYDEKIRTLEERIIFLEEKTIE